MMTVCCMPATPSDIGDTAVSHSPVDALLFRPQSASLPQVICSEAGVDTGTVYLKRCHFERQDSVIKDNATSAQAQSACSSPQVHMHGG